MMTQISNNLQICSYAGGVKLVRPEDTISGCLVSEVMNKDYNVYFLDAGHRMQAINDPSIESCGLQSARDAVGKTMEKFLIHPSHAKKFFEHEDQVMRSKKRFVFGQYGDLINGHSLDAVSTLWPWYDDHDNIIGTFGCAVVLQTTSLQDIARYMSDIQGLFSSFSQLDGKFSPREIDVIKLVMRGYSMRQIAVKLGLSVRTVESYFANIKIKANVTSKSELIDQYYGCL